MIFFSIKYQVGRRGEEKGDGELYNFKLGDQGGSYLSEDIKVLRKP